MKASTPQLKAQHIGNIKHRHAIPNHVDPSMEIASVAPEMVFWGSFVHRLDQSNKSKQVLVGNVGTNASSFGSRPHDIFQLHKERDLCKGSADTPIRQYNRRLQPWNSTVLVLQKPA
jgi:hypothetical protein